MRVLLRSALLVILPGLSAGSAWAQAGAQSKATPGGQPNVAVKPGTPGFVVPGATPWFQNPATLRELRLNEQQAQRLNDAYGQTFGLYKDRFGKLESMNPNERAARFFELQRTFGTDFLKSAGDTLNEQQLQRFNQQQGFSVFMDPQLQKQLTLTDPQLQQLRQASQDFDRQMLDMNRAGNTEEAGKRFDTLSRQRMEQINKVLNEQQRRTWREMTGEPFMFPPAFGAPLKSAPPPPR